MASDESLRAALDELGAAQDRCFDQMAAELRRLREENARLQQEARNALGTIELYGGADGDHHKQWVLDQVLRHLLGDKYEAWVTDYCSGPDGPDTYEWDEGIAP